MTLSRAAAEMLSDLVDQHCDGIESGNISYGTEEDNQEALEILAELAELAKTRQVAL